MSVYIKLTGKCITLEASKSLQFLRNILYRNHNGCFQEILDAVYSCLPQLLFRHRCASELLLKNRTVGAAHNLYPPKSGA
jgi:hypothetical protein